MRRIIPYKLLIIIIPVTIFFLILSIISIYGSVITFKPNNIEDCLTYVIITFISLFIVINLFRIVLFSSLIITDDSLIISQIGIQPVSAEWNSPGYHFSLRKSNENIKLNTIIRLGYLTEFKRNKSRFWLLLIKPVYFELKNGNKVIWDTFGYSTKQVSNIVNLINS